ncbi:hypothetical protein DERF_008796 [Dermatophagoides farinae]|uniref:Uncharacterized protein n=1 Tax=Dermatophagoides farinae TaxID=6954 RepID=A0A922I351_DERFA|nr:hypothetical protein DERF_008796 [Dermatophagoides farinae]
MISREDSDKISSLMGTYLLQGYTLLDDYCSICKTPLMRKRMELAFCMYCDHLKKKPDNEEQWSFATFERKSQNETLAMISDDQPDEDNFTPRIRNKMQKIIMNMIEDLETQSQITSFQGNVRQNLENMSLLIEMIDKTIVMMKKL